MQPDDIRIPDSMKIAADSGIKFFFSTVQLQDAHPNTAILNLQEKAEEKFCTGIFCRRRKNNDKQA